MSESTDLISGCSGAAGVGGAGIPVDDRAGCMDCGRSFTSLPLEGEASGAPPFPGDVGCALWSALMGADDWDDIVELLVC